MHLPSCQASTSHHIFSPLLHLSSPYLCIPFSDPPLSTSITQRSQNPNPSSACSVTTYHSLSIDPISTCMRSTTFKVLMLLALLATSALSQAPSTSPPEVVITPPTPSPSPAIPSPAPEAAEPAPSNSPTASSPYPAPSTSPASSSASSSNSPVSEPAGKPSDNASSGWSGVTFAATALFRSLVAASFYSLETAIC